MTAGSAAQPEVLQASNIQDNRHVGNLTADGHVIQHYVTWQLQKLLRLRLGVTTMTATSEELEHKLSNSLRVSFVPS
jgi:hypothetical protein